MDLLSPLRTSLTSSSAPLVAVVVASILVGLASRRCRRTRQRHLDVLDDAPQPKWAWFCVSNVIAVTTFGASVAFLLKFWLEHGGDVHSPAFAFTQPAFAASLIVALGSLLYLLAFFGVAIVHEDLTDLPMASTDLRFAPGQPEAAPLSPEVDADVVIVGLGLAGSTLATVLARQGKKVVVIEKSKELYETIKGELLQPGGVRALERMGLGACAKVAEIDPIRVDGYVVIPSGGAPGTEVVMSYPTADPKSWREYLGMLADAAPPAVTAANAGSAKAGSVGTGSTEACPVTGDDLTPHGRSFYNTRFVQELRAAALAEPNVTVVWGCVRKAVAAREYAAVASQREGVAKTRGASPAGLPSWTADPDRIVGVQWAPLTAEGKPDLAATPRVSIAPLTIAADGMYSTLRKELHTHAPRTVSHFCGLILEHPPSETPLPYPNRGHVVMVDPNPVLFYQISSTQTRVLVDVPGELPSIEDGSLRRYFEGTVAAQLPECLRASFLAAAATQEPVCMPNKPLTAAPPTKKGVLMVGDTLNMRHPLTGGGMTVALKDSELVSRCLRDVPLRTGPGGAYSERRVEDAIATFHARRGAHASTINILANALHRVFSKPAKDDGTRERLRAACVHYLAMGGAFTAGPIGLLSGLTPRPDVLVTHFFAVALHAMRLAVFPLPTPSRLRQAYDLIRIACVIIMPLLAAEQATFMSWPVAQSTTDLLFSWRSVDPKTL